MVGRVPVWLSSVVLLALFLAEGFGLTLSAALPRDLPPALSGWQKIEGEVEDARACYRYAFYVNPERPGLYEVTHYRVYVSAREGIPAEDRAEMVLWNSGTGPLHAYVKRADGAWVALRTDTSVYRREMYVALHLYSLHNLAVQDREERAGR
jgi:hypothetical protein